MDNWTYRPWHLNTCSFRLICKPNWSSSLKILVKSFLFLFWKKYDHPQNPVLNSNFRKCSKAQKAIALHIFLSSASTSSATSSLFWSHLPHGDHHQNVKTTLTFWHVVFYNKVGWTGGGCTCVWQFTFTQIYHYYQCLNVGRTVRRPLWCEIGHRGSRKLLLANNNDRWRCFPWKYHMERAYSLFS